jgi:predicted CoA-binding protein
VEEVLALPERPSVIWMQIGVEHPEAAAKAEAEGITVIQNRCPKIEYQRLFGELRMGGFNTGVISSKL